jgi:hypothetical protein
MTLYRQSYADRLETGSSAFRVRRRTKTLAAGAVRTLNLTLADALYAYAVTGSAFATLMVRRFLALPLPREGMSQQPRISQPCPDRNGS